MAMVFKNQETLLGWATLHGSCAMFIIESTKVGIQSARTQKGTSDHDLVTRCYKDISVPQRWHCVV